MINYLRQIVKISLSFSIFTLILSIILNLIFKEENWKPDSISGAIIWYSIFIAIYSIGFSVLTIIILIVYCLNIKNNVWESLKKEITLIIFTVSLLVIFILSNWMIHKNV